MRPMISSLIPSFIYRRSFLAVLLSCFVAVGLVSCDDHSKQEITVDVALESVLEEDQTQNADQTLGAFTTDLGWQVTLDEAVLVIGPIWGVEEEEGAHADANVWHEMWRKPMQHMQQIWMPRAYAHGPGGGDSVLVEVLDQVAFDALDASGMDLGSHLAESGHVGEILIELEEAEGEVGDATHGHHAWVRGSATKMGVSVLFQGGVHIEDDMHQVEIAFHQDLVEGAMGENGTLTIGVHVDAWFEGVDFGELTEIVVEDSEDNTEGRKLITEDSAAHSTWLENIRSSDAYSARWSL